MSKVSPALAASFWKAVEDCLVEFHHYERERASAEVFNLRLRMPRGIGIGEELSFEDMIYHSEPWWIACDLANAEIEVGSNQSAYTQVLRQNELA